MTIRHLKIFLEVARCGKMNIAAKNLFLSQPTISQAIRELENYYGVLLFERLSKKLFITEDGEKLREYAREVVDAFDHLEYNMSSEKLKERLRVGSSVTVGACVIPQILEDFSEEKPDVDVYSYVSNTQSVEERLLNAKLDIAVVEGKIHSPELITIPLQKDYLVLFCSQHHPFAGRKTIHVSDLAQTDFVMREEGSGTRELFEDFMKLCHQSVKIKWEVDGFGATRNVVLREPCVSVASIRLIADDVLGGNIYAIRNQQEGWNRTFHLVYHKNKYMTKAMQTFITIAKEQKAPQLFEQLTMGELIL